MKTKLQKTDKDKKINKVSLYRRFINLTALQNKLELISYNNNNNNKYILNNIKYILKAI